MIVEVINGMADTIAKLEEELQSYKDWVDLEDSVKIAECVHRYGSEFVIKACEEALNKTG